MQAEIKYIHECSSSRKRWAVCRLLRLREEQEEHVSNPSGRRAAENRSVEESTVQEKNEQEVEQSFT